MSPPNALLDELLGAPDRDGLCSDLPIVSARADDDPGFLRAVERVLNARADLDRRGIWHGSWAELGWAHAASGAAASRAPRAPSGADSHRRWGSARPVLVRGLARDVPARHAADLDRALIRFESLSGQGGLERWLATRREALATDFAVGPAMDLVDRERDVARVSIAADGMDDLWIKTARLSTHPNDASLRMRFSFGREGPDDANPDPARARAVHDLAARALPEVRAVLDVEELRRFLDSSCATRVLPTQAIAYWNAPHGGPSTSPSSSDSSASCSSSSREAPRGSRYRWRTSNFGRGRTAMHSVFCASRDVTYALSFGLRAFGSRAQGRSTTAG